MALIDLAHPGPAPNQLVIDSSLLLALRPGDDNPRAMIAHRFIGWLGQQVIDQQTAAWLLPSVLQECYHVILSRAIRRAWEALPVVTRPANWLAEAERLRVSAVVTLNSDWRRVTEFDIYTTPI